MSSLYTSAVKISDAIVHKMFNGVLTFHLETEPKTNI